MVKTFNLYRKYVNDKQVYTSVVQCTLPEVGKLTRMNLWQKYHTVPFANAK